MVLKWYYAVLSVCSPGKTKNSWQVGCCNKQELWNANIDCSLCVCCDTGRYLFDTRNFLVPEWFKRRWFRHQKQSEFINNKSHDGSTDLELD